MAFDSDGFTNSTSVSEQIQSGLNTASGAASSSLSGLQSSASGVIGSIKDIGGKLFNEGSSIINSGTQSLNQLGSFTTVSKFADNLRPPKSIIQDSPELARGKTTSPVGSLIYPKDISNYSITFIFMQYYQDSPLVQKKDRPTVTITLPMPSDLVDKFNTNYAAKDLGLVGKALTESGFFERVSKGQFKGIGAATGEGIGEQITPGNIYAAGRSALGDTGLGNAADRALGVVVNPYTALQFNGVGLRKHSFKFKLSPNSRDEALEVQKIIRAFKERMLPEKNGLLFNFPDSCMILFNTPSMPYSFKTCFLENLSVNYAPSGTPSFFKNGEFASEVEITLEFGETEPVTRDDILRNQGDLTGTSNPYEASGTPTGVVSRGNIPDVFSPTYFGGTSEGE
jgi:hypothetical protein